MKTYLFIEIDELDDNGLFETAHLTAYRGEEATDLNIKLSYNQVDKIISTLRNVTNTDTFREAWMREVILGEGWGLVITEESDDDMDNGDVNIGGKQMNIDDNGGKLPSPTEDNERLMEVVMECTQTITSDPRGKDLFDRCLLDTTRAINKIWIQKKTPLYVLIPVMQIVLAHLCDEWAGCVDDDDDQQEIAEE